MIRALHVLAILIAGILAFALFLTKVDAQNAQQRLADLRSGIATEKNLIAQLQDDYAHLKRPERLARLAKSQLGVQPVKPAQVVALRSYAVTPPRTGDAVPAQMAMAGEVP